ncbi:MAG: 2-amino-4-hydroxy-6-hydroxymethyldihydropteridine diphosphokinase [Planctomycetota bacterium]
MQRYKFKTLNTIIFSTGSNLGNRQSHLDYAKKELARIGEIIDYSSIYESEAWGNTDQQNFLNQIIVVSTKLTSLECLIALQEIENERDRIREIHWGPRTLDIDILFYDQEIINTHKLIIPHPFIEKRLFVLLPLSEILSEYIHPVLNKNITEILNQNTDKSKVILYKEQTKN